MNKPTVTQAYAMIRLLKKQPSSPETADRIRQLEQLITEEKDAAAARDLDRFFSGAPVAKPGPKR